jgi:hypothetical protein
VGQHLIEPRQQDIRSLLGGTRATLVASMIALLLMAGCGRGATDQKSTAAAGPSPEPSDVAMDAPEPPPVPDWCRPKGTALEISALNVRFTLPMGRRTSPDEICLAAPAGKPFTIDLHNDLKNKGNAYVDEHNITIKPYEGSPDLIFQGDSVAAKETITYDIPALEPAVYFFVCDFHRDFMKGILNVE